MTKADNTYRLVVFDEPDDPLALRELLCQVTGSHPTDAMQWVALCAGVWHRPLAEGEVRELLDGLFELGIAAEAWRADRLPELLPVRTIHDAACLPEGFRVKGLRGEPIHWVPWDKVDLVSAGRIAAEDEFHAPKPPKWGTALATSWNALVGRPIGPPRRARARRVVRDPVGEVLIVRREPRITFRAVETRMSFAYLGDRLRPSAAENFPLFVADLCTAAADRAFITNPTRAFLEGIDPDDFEFPSSQALLDYSTHRLLWSWYRRDRDEQRPTMS